MDIKRWNHVVAVANQRSFARAADQVHLSQPALSRSIQAAEAELGVRLFDRGPLEVVPTAAGEFVVARARQLVFDSRCLERDVALYVNRELGDTAFGCGPFPAATFVPPLLAGLRREFPGINVRVEISNWEQLLTRLRDEDIEFFVADTRDLRPDPRLQVRPLRMEAGGFYVRSGHPLPLRKPVTLAQVWSYGVATVRVPTAIRSALSKLLGLASPAELAFALECDHLDVLKAVALESDVVLAAPHSALVAELRSKAFRAAVVADLPPLASSMGIVTMRGRSPSPMADLMIRRLPTAR